MPFTPFHMGPGIVIKAVLQGSFSLMVFGWSQVVMDIQPLLVMISGEGHLHGFSHTYLGATLLAVFSGLSGKYLAEIGLYVLGLNQAWQVRISWCVAFLSAFVGTYTHVVLDSIMHADVEPFAPLSVSNGLLHIISNELLHILCVASALLGGIAYVIIRYLTQRRQQRGI